jgi:hypothetical protein
MARMDPERRDLDASIDATLQALTDVDGVAHASHTRTIAALRSHRAVHDPVWRHPQTLQWAHWRSARGMAVAAAVLLVIALAWMAGRPRPERHSPALVGRNDPPAEQRGSVAPTQTTRMKQGPLDPPDLQGDATPRARPAVTRRRPDRAPVARPDNRLAAVIAAVKQLPPEVWTRADETTSDLSPIAVEELMLPPLEIAPMPDAAPEETGATNPGALR